MVLLNKITAVLAKKHEIVCVFVNAEVLHELSAQGVRQMPCAVLVSIMWI